MKRIGRYWVNHEIKWITVSGVMMGVAFFAQVLMYFGLTPLQQSTNTELIFMAILPMVLEAAWCILLQGVKLKPAFIFGVLGAVICVLLMCQSFVVGGFFRILLSVIMYPIAAAAMVFIICGFFPYRLFGFAAFAVVLVIRILFFGPVAQLFLGDWKALLGSLPGICNTAALMFLFSGIRATRMKKE